MHLPDYNGNSIVNLMSSVRDIYGSEYLYPVLNGFDIEPLKEKNIVFIIIDGLGYDFLMGLEENCFLKQHIIRKMTSVFPSSTASAYISIATGVAPQQHGLTGWFMFLKETGILTSILPFVTKAGGIPLNNIPFSDIFDQESFFSGLETSSFCIMHKSLTNSQCSKMITKGAKRKSYTDIKDFSKRIENIIGFGDNNKFIFAYWDQLDKISHEKGVKSQEAFAHFKMLDEEIGKLAASLDGSNTALIITADHGFIDTSEECTIKLEDHPGLVETLALPISGEPRVAYCYVKPGKVSKFEKYITENLKEYCDIYKSPELIEKGFFGLYAPHTKLYQRTGDYTLIMKDNYIIKETLPGQKYKELVGIHGGLTSEEMFVPLIVIS